MRVFYGFEKLTKINNPVITTGTFDGVHVGHKTILNRLKKLAGEHNGESVLVTFHPHPRKVLYPESKGKNLKMINTMEEKIEMLESAGLDNLVFVEFTSSFAGISGKEFIEKYIYKYLAPRVIVVGFNHYFGHNKEGDYQFLQSVAGKYGFLAEEIPEQEVQNETVSSTEIRKALADGYIQRVNAYLDHYYFISGPALKCRSYNSGESNARLVLRIDDEDKLLPRAGSYAVSIPDEISYTRALAVLEEQKEGARFLEIIACDDDDQHNLLNRELLKLNFHKRIGGVNRESAVSETRELIF